MTIKSALSREDLERYKENLLVNAKYEAKKRGVRVVKRGLGGMRHICFYFPSGRKLEVWYPEGNGRVNDNEIYDLKEAIVAIKETENPYTRNSASAKKEPNP